MTAIDKVLNIAAGEVGYLEKKSNDNLDSMTANAGSNNYTKYWRDIKPDYQGQPWCAAFVTWCFVQAFGKDTAKKLLKHYPYVYCPTMASLFTLNANPQRGDIVIFKHGGEFTHTGIVTSVSGDYFTTIEGNTSGGSTIIANGGAVCKKGYYNSNLPGTKFCRPDYSIAEQSEHWAQPYYDKLCGMGYITDDMWKDFDGYLPAAYALALLDKTTGGKWTSDEADASIHWSQPHIISLCGKGVITDKSEWIGLVLSGAYLSKALCMALVDKITGGMKPDYVGREADHWARNHLDSLCDKAIITTPEAWADDFEAPVTYGAYIKVLCAALGI